MEKLTPRKRKAVQRLGVTPRPVKVFAMLMLPVILAMIVACDTTSNEPYSLMPEGKPPLYTENRVPDPKEALETRPAGALPEFIALSTVLTTKEKERTTSYYQGAMDHYDSYKYIPCYCGCAIYTTPHKNLAECFIKERTAAAETVFTDHSLTCSQCQEAAKLTLEGIAAGTPLKDIRATVHNAIKYTEIWTDTPPVP